MAVQLTLSSNENNVENGPTLIHSTDVKDYKIPPEVIRILQDSLTNDLLSDETEGVLCQAAPDRILDILRQHGFHLQNQSNDDGKIIWTVVQNDGSGNGEDADQSNEQNPRSMDEGEGEGNTEGDEQGGDEQGGNEDGGQEE